MIAAASERSGAMKVISSSKPFFFAEEWDNFVSDNAVKLWGGFSLEFYRDMACKHFLAP